MFGLYMFYDLRQEYRLPKFPPKYFFSVLIEKYILFGINKSSALDFNTLF